MSSTVRPAISARVAAASSASVCGSRCAVGSSRISSGASLQEGAGQGQPLRLPAAEPQRRVRRRPCRSHPAGCDEVASARACCAAAITAARPASGRRQADVVGDAALEQVRAPAAPRRSARARRPGRRRARSRPTDEHPAVLGATKAQQQRGDGALARAAGADQGHRLPRRGWCSETSSSARLLPPRVGDSARLRGRGRRAGRAARSGPCRSWRRVRAASSRAKMRRRRGRAGHARVEALAEHAQRQVELRGQDQHEEGPRRRSCCR